MLGKKLRLLGFMARADLLSGHTMLFLFISFKVCVCVSVRRLSVCTHVEVRGQLIGEVLYSGH